MNAVTVVLIHMGSPSEKPKAVKCQTCRWARDFPELGTPARPLICGREMDDEGSLSSVESGGAPFYLHVASNFACVQWEPTL